MKVSATLKGQPDAHGCYAIYIRVADGTYRKTQATSYRVKKTHFDKGKVINRPDADIINAALQMMIAKKIVGGGAHYPDAPFDEYVEQLITETQHERSYETSRQYRAEKTKLEGFRRGVRLSHIDPSFLRAYATYCYGLGNVGNTVWKTFKFLRMLLRRAVAAKIIQDNPFDGFSMPRYKDPKKTYLTIDQVQTLYDALPKLADLQFVATWFLIGCYTGLRFGDMQAFTKKNIKNGRLVIYTGKTGEVISMPISAKVKTMLEAIDYKPLSYPNNHCNAALRGILSFCKINEPITWHSSRHTFATMCAELGISQEVTAKLLGHRSLRSTGIYYKITNPRIDEEISRLQ